MLWRSFPKEYLIYASNISFSRNTDWAVWWKKQKLGSVGMFVVVWRWRRASNTSYKTAFSQGLGPRSIFFDFYTDSHH